MDLTRRAYLPELMDDDSVDAATYQRCLRNLATINLITFTHRATLNFLAAAIARLPPGQTVSILDVAYGQGDLLRAIARWAAKAGVSVRLSGIDLNPRSAIAARAATPPQHSIDYQTGDVFSYQPAAPVDFILSSQFTHHLTDGQIVRLLAWFEETARHGWFISDLHRHGFAYYSFPLLARLMFWHPIVRHDGQVSIARSFTRAEWQGLLAAAGSDASITWHPLFRFGIARLKP